MIASNVARRYAKALLEIGIETSTLDAMVEELGAVAGAWSESAELRNALQNPLVAHDAKRQILGELATRLGLGQTSKNALLLLGDRRRLPALPGIAQLLKEMSDARKGLLRAEVITAVTLSDAYYARLEAQLEKMTGKKVALDKRLDPTILGGVIARIGDTVIDGSIKTRLSEMKNNLLSDAIN